MSPEGWNRVRAWLWYGPAGLAWMRAASAASGRADAATVARYRKETGPVFPLLVWLRRGARGKRAGGPDAASGGPWTPSWTTLTTVPPPARKPGGPVILLEPASHVEASAIEDAVRCAASLPAGADFCCRTITAPLAVAGLLVWLEARVVQDIEPDEVWMLGSTLVRRGQD